MPLEAIETSDAKRRAVEGATLSATSRVGTSSRCKASSMPPSRRCHLSSSVSMVGF